MRCALSYWSQNSGSSDHRLAEAQRLGDGVVAAVGDHEVDVRQDRDLRQELGAGHVAGELELVVLRALGDDDAVAALPASESISVRISSTSPEPSEPRLR